MGLLVSIGLLLVAGGALMPWVIRWAYRAPRRVEQGTPADVDLPFRAVHIPMAKGKRLFAWLVPAATGTSPVPAVAVLHGWGGNAEQMLPFAALLQRAGYSVLLIGRSQQWP